MTNPTKPQQDKSNPKMNQDKYLLRLYIAGKTPNCMTALKNLEKICEEYLQNKYKIEVIDLLVNPELAEHDQILAIPTVVRKLPLPICRAIGNLSNTELVLIGLDLRKKQLPEL